MQQQPGAVVIDLNLFRERRSQERERARLASALASPPPIALVALWAPMLLVPSAYGWGIGWSGMPALYGVGV